MWFFPKKHHHNNFTPIKIQKVISRRTFAIRSIAFLILVGWAFYTFILPKGTEAAWKDPAWGYRKKIVINNAQVTGGSDLTNFPVMIQMRDIDVKANALANGYDIMFTSSDGVTKLDHEIEKYTSTTGDLVAWVEIPTLATATDTTIYMYYGNRSATDQQNVTGVWDSNYKGVWHMKETSSSRSDSTSNANTLSDVGGVGAGTKLGNSSTYIAANTSRLTVADGTQNGLDITGSITLETWVYTTDTTITQGLVTKDGGSGNNGYLLRYNLNGRFNLLLSSNGTLQTSNNGTTIVSAGQWYHVVGVYDGTDMRVYVNGVLDSTPTAYTGGIFNNTNAFNLGVRATLSQPMEGQLDESRVSDIARSADWIATSYNNMNSPSTFYTVNDKESGPVMINWKFDELTGSTANDSSGHSNSGTISGPTWKDESMCVTGGCLLMDSGSVSRTYSSDNELDPATGSFTNSIWFKHNNTAPTDLESVIVRYDSGGGYAVYMNTSGNMCFGIDDDSTWGPDDSACSTITYLDSKWHYISAIKNDTTSIQLYIDGIRVAETTSLTATGSLSGTSPATYVGTDGSIFDPWQGFVDDFKFYNYNQNASQVSTSYASRGNVKGASAVIGRNDDNALASNLSLSDNLVGYWKLDEESGTSAADSSGNSNTGTATGTTIAAAKFSYGRTFNGTSDIVTIPNNAAFKPTTAITTSVWFKAGTQSGFGRILSTNTTQNIGYDIILQPNANGNHIQCDFAPGGTQISATSTGSYNDNVWHLATCTYDGSKVRVYVDGQLQGSTAGTGAISYTAVQLAFGAGANTSNFFEGSIDEVRIYSRALSDLEVQSLYNWNAQPIFHMKFDENTGSISKDSSGSGYDGTLMNSATFSPGKFGPGVRLNGTNQYVRVSSQSGLNITAGTVTAWVNPSSTPASDQQIVMGNKETSRIYLQRIATTGNFGIRLGTSTIVDTGFALAANTWNHVALSYNNGTYVAFVNGRQVATGAYSGLSALNGYSIIGAYDDLAGDVNSYFPGVIDDVKMYNYARTEKQVAEDMNGGHPGPAGSPLGTAVGYWKLDEGNGTVAKNSGTGSSMDGTLTTIASPATSTSGWTNSGKFGKAIVFDGTSDYVSVGNQVSAQITGAVTLSAWVNLTNTSSTHMILTKDGANGSQNGYRIYTNTSGQLVMDISGNGSTRISATGATTLATGTWYHVVGVYDPSTSITVYVNGRQDGVTTTSVPSSIHLANGGVQIGAANAGTFMAGIIDEAKLFAGALTAEQVRLDYNQGKATVFGSVGTESDGVTSSFNQAREYCIPGASSGTCTSPVAYWKLDERTGTSAFDISGNENTGTLTNGPLWTAGKVGSSVLFDGSDDYITKATPVGLPTGQTARTIEAWVNPTNTSTGGSIFHYGNDATAGQEFIVSIITTTGTTYIFSDGVNSSNNVTITGAEIPVNNIWSHIAFTFDGSTGYKYYLNGRLMKTGSFAVTINTATPTIANIGDRTDVASTNFPGNIDDVKVFNYARNAAQIAWDYNKGRPAAWFKFDECTGSTVYDASGQGNNGTVTIGGSGSQAAVGECNNNAATARYNGLAGKFSFALNFDGSDDYVQTSNVGILAPDGIALEGLSFGAWIKPTSFAATSGVIQKSNEMLLDISTGGLPQCYIQSGGLSRGPATSSVAISSSQWSHVMCTFDSTTIRVFINGRETGSSAYSGSVQSSSSNALYIGQNSAGGTFTTGMIDDARYYNYALTPNQISTVINEGSAVRFGP